MNIPHPQIFVCFSIRCHRGPAASANPQEPRRAERRSGYTLQIKWSMESTLLERHRRQERKHGHAAPAATTHAGLRASLQHDAKQRSACSLVLNLASLNRRVLGSPPRSPASRGKIPNRITSSLSSTTNALKHREHPKTHATAGDLRKSTPE